MTVKNSKCSEKFIRTPDKKALVAARTRGKAPALSREQIQRELLLGGMARAAAENGFGAVSVEDVLEMSKLSRDTFYKHFDDKEECFLAAYDAAAGAILERVEEAVANEATATGRAEAGLRALVVPLAREPAIARLVAIEIRAAGAIGQERYSRALERLGRLIAVASGRGHVGAAADDVSRLVAGAVSSTIVREVGEGRAAQMERLVPELVFTVLTPCMGSERAGEEMWRVADRAAMSV
jgi:AcrR family transcriptional regulator